MGLSAPKQPNPYAVAQAQGQMNKETAIASQQLNMVDQYTPDGSLTYQQTGTYSDGTPRFAATTTLSAAQQAQKEQQDRLGLQASQAANDQLSRVSSALSTPFNVDAAAEDKLYALGRARLDPRFAQQDADLEANLINRGIRPGSQAYGASRDVFERSKNDAYNELALNGRQQAVSEALTERNQPLNEMRALLGLDAVDTPQFVNTPKTSVANTDLAGLVSDNYRNKSAQYQATIGGLFGLGSAIAGAGGRYLGGR